MGGKIITTQEVTLNLPEPIYDQIRRAAEKSHRSIDDILLETILAATPTLDAPVGPLRAALAHLAYLNGAALWQVARATLLPVQSERLAELHDKQQREGLTVDEQEEEQSLLALY